MIYSNKRLLTLLVIGFTFQSTLGQQPEKSTVLPASNVTTMSREEMEAFESKVAYDGLDFPTAVRLERSTKNASIIDVIALFRQQRSFKDLKLTQADAQAFSAAIGNRLAKRQQSKRKWRLHLVNEGTPTEKAISDAVSGLEAEESASEQEVTKAINEILDPEQMDTLCRFAMGQMRMAYARIPLIATHLGLTKDQISKYEACRLANEECAEQASRTESSEEIQSLQKRVERLGLAADDSLNSDQFLFVGRSVGFIKADESLRDFYLRMPEDQRIRLAKDLHLFREMEVSLSAK